MGCSILDMLFHLELSQLEVFFCLYNQDEPKRDFQSIHSYSLTLVGDGASRFQQEWDQRARPCFWSLGWPIRGSELRISPTPLVVDFGYNTLQLPLCVICSLLAISKLLMFLFVWCGQGDEKSSRRMGGEGLL